MIRSLALVCIFWSVSGVVSAGGSPVQDWIARAHRQHLATSSQWLQLVHYRPNTLRSGYTSFASGRSFFLADNGRGNPQAELDATLRAIALPVTDQPDMHAQCRFIARFHWLKKVLAIPDNQLPHVSQISRDTEMRIREQTGVAGFAFERYTFAANSMFDLAASSRNRVAVGFQSL